MATPTRRDFIRTTAASAAALAAASSWSIDHQRFNFQFSGQAFYEVRNGKIAGMLRDVA